MRKGIVFQGLIPMRKEPSEISEMVSQVLFGEKFQILETKGKWLLISLDFDGFMGWVIKDRVHIFESENSADLKDKAGYRMVSHPFITVSDLYLGQQLILPSGSIWPNRTSNLISVNGKDFELDTDEGLIIPGADIDPEEIGRKLVSLPNIWGGRSGFGFDAAGLVQMLWRMMGIKLPRGCEQQSELGTTINFIHEVRKGDLAFFDNEEGVIVHVGMVIDAGRILHSANDVRIDRFDLYGIYSNEKEAYTHKLRVVRRVGGEW